MLDIGDTIWYYSPGVDGVDYHSSKIVAKSIQYGYYVINENKEMLWVTNWIDSSLETLKERIKAHQEYCKDVVEQPINTSGYTDFIPN